MNNSFILSLISISSLLIGSLIGYSFNSINNPNIHVEKKEAKEVVKSRLEYKEVLPKFIQTDLQQYDIETKNLTQEDWQFFLEQVKTTQLKNLSFDGSKKNLLHLAAQDGSIHLVQKLIDLGFDIDKKDKRGFPALFYAISQNNMEIINLLIENGANLYVNQYEKFEDDALTRALNGNEYLQSNFIQYLFDHGFELKTKHFRHINKGNNKYLMNFLENTTTNAIYKDNGRIQLGYFESIIGNNGNNEVIQYMLNNKVDLETIPNKHNILHFAITNKNVSLNSLEQIVDKIDINTQNPLGRTALMTAVQFGEIDKIKYLLTNGAKIDMYDKQGKSAYNLIGISKRVKNDSTKEYIKNLLDQYSKKEQQ